VKPDPDEVARLKGTLSERGDAVAATLAALPPWSETSFAALTKAAKGSKRRAEALADVLLALGDGDHPDWADAADAAVAEALASTGRLPRSHLVQACAFVPARRRFSAALRAIAATPDDPAWAHAVHTLGQLRDPDAADVLMDHTAGQATPFVVLNALVQLRDPIATVVFEANLGHPEPRTRTYALWGLAALAYDTPIAGLIDLLDDPDDTGPRHRTPGQSMRAAQALCDVFDWPFTWGADAVVATRARCDERFDEAQVLRWREALAAGKLTAR